MSVNNYIREPTSPGEWVDSFSCSVCNELYSDFKSNVSFKDGYVYMQHCNQDLNGGYRTRKTILWCMRVMKLNLWYEKHMYCGYVEEGS